MEELINCVVKSDIWKKFKLLGRNDLHYNSVFATYVLKKLGFGEIISDEVEQERNWTGVQGLVEKRLTGCRNAATQNFKNAFFGKYELFANDEIFGKITDIRYSLPLQDLSQTGQLPTKADIFQLRKNQGYLIFFTGL